MQKKVKILTFRREEILSSKILIDAIWYWFNIVISYVENCLDDQAEEKQRWNKGFEDPSSLCLIRIVNKSSEQIRVEVWSSACRFMLHCYLQIAWVTLIINFHNFSVSLTSNCLAALHSRSKLGFSATNWAIDAWIENEYQIAVFNKVFARLTNLVCHWQSCEWNWASWSLQVCKSILGAIIVEWHFNILANVPASLTWFVVATWFGHSF